MIDALLASYPWVKSLHVIAVIAWMAGLFYLPRLFVYHAEQVEKGSPTDTMFQTMERRLSAAIMNPAMIATWVFGLALVFTPGIVDWSDALALDQGGGGARHDLVPPLVRPRRKDFLNGTQHPDRPPATA